MQISWLPTVAWQSWTWQISYFRMLQALQYTSCMSRHCLLFNEPPAVVVFIFMAVLLLNFVGCCGATHRKRRQLCCEILLSLVKKLLSWFHNGRSCNSLFFCHLIRESSPYFICRLWCVSCQHFTAYVQVMKHGSHICLICYHRYVWLFARPSTGIFDRK